MKKMKWIAVAMCLVLLFESLAVFPTIADNSPVRALRSGAVTVTGTFPQTATLAAKKIANPFNTTNPSPWWPGWLWGWYNSLIGSVVKNSKENPAPKNNEPFDALAFYDIKVMNNGATVHPSDAVTVTIKGLSIPKDKAIQVIHVLDDFAVIRKAIKDGTATAMDAPGFVEAFPKEAQAAYDATGKKGVVYVEYLTSNDGTVTILDNRTISFRTNSFSVFIITETTLETSVTASDGNTYEISVRYDVRADIPNDAVLQVGEILEDAGAYTAYADRAAQVFGCGAEDLNYIRLFDISLYGTESGEYYQPNSPVTVSIRVKDTGSVSTSSLKVVHFGTKVEELSAEVEDDVVSFSTNGFSVYALAAGTYRHTYRFFVPTDETQTSYEEYHIYTDTGETTFTQIIKDHSELVMPQLPSIPNSQSSTFAGWYVGTVSGNTVTIENDPFDFTNLPEIDSDREIRLYARFGKFAYVIFHEQYNGTTETWPIAATRRGEIENGSTSTSVRIDDVTVSYDDPSSQHAVNPGESPPPPAMAFRGWTTRDQIATDGTGTPYVPETATITPSPITISSTTDLYPVFSHINWLTTVSGPTGSGATYFAPTFYYSDEGLTNLNDYIPERKGYVFAGWYCDKDANGNGTGVQIANASGALVATAAQLAGTGLTISDGKLMLSQNVTIYGRWTPGPATYTVVIWRQSVLDNKTTTTTPADVAAWVAADPDNRTASDYPGTVKSYDFAESIVVTSTSEAMATVANTYKQRSGGDYEGFYYSCCDADTVVDGNGTTVLNVYYDRELRTILFRNHPSGSTVYYYTPTTSNTGTQYGYINGTFEQLSSSSSFSSLDGITEYTGQRYNTTTSTNTNPQQYGVVDGQVVPLTKTGNNWYYNGTRYRGTRYVENNNGTYGFDSASGQMVTVQTVSQWTYNGNPYNGRRYTRNTQNTAVVWMGLYGQTLSQAGYDWNDVNTYQWYANTSASGTIQTLVDSFNFANDSSGTVYNLYRSGNAGTSNIIHYKQQLDGTYSQEQSVTAHGSGGNFSFQNKFFGFTVDTYNTGNNGFSSTGGSRAATGTSNSYPLHIYHKRNEYTLTFLDSFDNSYAYGTEAASTASLLYEEPLSGYLPGTPPVPSREGYEFSGWYYDASCTTRVDWSKTMPGGNMVVYAGWSTEWYLIKIDPNGGEFPAGSNYSTWFWKQYGTTELIAEYENTERDYSESLNGTWYYAIQDRDHYGLTDEWENREDDIHDRRAYYTQDISDDAIVDLGAKFKQAVGAYRYANWFEVLFDEHGNEIGEELYNFSRRIDHNTTLRLHWKHVGTYYIRYDAGAGQLDGNDSNEDTFHLLDESDYADHSDVVVTRTATPAEGYNFIGWKIRGDDSGTIYYPGLAMEFQSKFAVKETVNGDVREYLILDAVYSVAKTAKIIYNANGGTVNSSTVDYGAPTDSEAPTPATSCTDTEATITNLVNNTGVVLSDGTGFTLTDAMIVGWNTKADGSGEHFDLGGSYYVDAEEPIVLYAEWEVRVYFYKNNTEPGSTWGGTWDPDVYTFDSENERYYTNVLLGHPVDLPGYTPTDPRDNVVFHFWSTVRYIYPATGDDPYDFSQPVNGELHLYAYWATPIEVPIHVVDSTSQTLVNKDTWLLTNSMQVISGTNTQTATTADAAVFVDVPPAQPGEDDYLFAFACISDSMEHITEDKIITSVYYDNATRSAWVTYANGTTGQLPSTDEIYFVYFRYPRTVDIEYKVMDTAGNLSDPSSLRTERVTSASIGDYNMPSDTAQPAVSRPRYWAYNNYSYYSYAIGDADATDSHGLRLITSASNTDTDRPALQVRNFWNGYRYSVDGGTTWIPCGKDITLYVIYFDNETKPIVVTINERVIGLEEDLLEEFEYSIVVTETVTNYTRTDRYTRSGNQWSGYTYNLNQTGTPTVVGTPTETQIGQHSIDLRHGESDSETLFYIKSTEALSDYVQNGSYWERTATYAITTQTITVTQTPKAGFVTTTDHSSVVPTYVYTYTSAENDDDQVVTFTNTHTPLTVEVHVAETVNGEIVLRDDTMRSNDYTLTLNIGENIDLSGTSPINPFAGDTSIYAFAGIVYGTHEEEGTIVTPTEVANSIAYQTVPPGTYYDVFFNENTNELLGDYQIYYIYYRLPTIYYVRQTAAGTLIPYSPVARNGASVTLNGHTVAQGDIVPVGENGTVISQSAAGGFRVPPDLDGSDILSSDYLRIGVGTNGVTNVSGLAATNDAKTLYLKAFDGELKWSFDNTSWNTFIGNPTVYVIYRDEQDNRLVIVREDGAAEQDFWYTVTGPGGVEIEVCIPAGRDRVTITDVAYGDYTAVEHSDWSWRYETEVSKSTTVYGPEDVRPAGALIGDSTIYFYGPQDNEYWLNGLDREENQYG